MGSLGPKHKYDLMHMVFLLGKGVCMQENFTCLPLLPTGGFSLGL